MADDDGFREAVQRLLLRTQASFQDTAAASVPLKRKGRKKGKGLDAAPEKEVPEVPEIPEKEVKPAERYEDLPRAFRDSFEKHREQVVSEFMIDVNDVSFPLARFCRLFICGRTPKQC